MSHVISIIDDSGNRMFLQALDYISGQVVFTDSPLNAAKYIGDLSLLQTDRALILRDLGFESEVFEVKHKFI